MLLIHPQQTIFSSFLFVNKLYIREYMEYILSFSIHKPQEMQTFGLKCTYIFHEPLKWREIKKGQLNS